VPHWHGWLTKVGKNSSQAYQRERHAFRAGAEPSQGRSARHPHDRRPSRLKCPQDRARACLRLECCRALSRTAVASMRAGVSAPRGGTTYVGCVAASAWSPRRGRSCISPAFRPGRHAGPLLVPVAARPIPPGLLAVRTPAIGPRVLRCWQRPPLRPARGAGPRRPIYAAIGLARPCTPHASIAGASPRNRPEPGIPLPRYTFGRFPRAGALPPRTRCLTETSYGRFACGRRYL